jgi:Rrf2 family nitric oxide-sensitive transcriptional repressor
MPMRLTAFTDFGLRVLMVLASDPRRSFTTAEIAGAFGISRNHQTKVVAALAQAGFVATQRGQGGGFRLARPADELRLGEVIRSLEASQAMVECFRADGGACRLAPDCRLRHRLAAGWTAFLTELDRTTLTQCAADLPAA